MKLKETILEQRWLVLNNLFDFGLQLQSFGV
jgi:hypothetical protein